MKLFTLREGIITCKNPSTCSHRPQITTFHDKIVSTLNEAMITHISSASNKNKRKKPPTIPGWNAEMDYAREESLYWHNIRFWIECDRPDSGIIFDIMKKCSRSGYHNMLRSMKKQRDDKIRVAISKETLQSSKDTYWSQVNSIRKNNFNTTSVIDGHTGDMNIANHF